MSQFWQRLAVNRFHHSLVSFVVRQILLHLIQCRVLDMVLLQELGWVDDQGVTVPAFNPHGANETTVRGGEGDLEGEVVDDSQFARCTI